MGVVYRAQDPAIGRTIAIKSIRLSDLTEAGERERLRERLFREAQSAGILSHPNIVTIYDIQEENGLAYIFMEFVDGPALEKLLNGDKLPDKDTLLGVLRQTASALDYAHKKGIVHRDIKPANIMIDDAGSAKITDFGVAKILSQQMTQSGTMMGTPSYMSPEQVQGGDVGGRSDQFALGVIAYEMLTGERPFVADYLPSLLYKICRDDPVPPQRLNPTLAPDVDAVFRRALSKEADHRYATCSEFVDELERACNLRSDWIPVTRGSSLSMPTVANLQAGPLLAGATRPVATHEAPLLSAHTSSSESVRPVPPAAAPVALAPAAPASQATGPAVIPREPVRLEEIENHTVRNIVLAVASIIVIGVIFLLTQKAFEAKPAAVTAENSTPTPVPLPEVNKPSPAPPPPAEPQEKPSSGASEEHGAETQKEPAAQKEASTRPAIPGRTPKGIDVVTQMMASPPGAQLIVDGSNQLACNAPCSVTLTPGRHTLLAKADGYRDTHRIFEIPRDASLSVDMERMAGTLNITTTPPGSTIILNGKPRPEKTPAALSLPVGSYRLQVVNGNLRSDEETVEIRDGGMSSRKYTLE